MVITVFLVHYINLISLLRTIKRIVCQQCKDYIQMSNLEVHNENITDK